MEENEPYVTLTVFGLIGLFLITMGMNQLGWISFDIWNFWIQLICLVVILISYGNKPGGKGTRNSEWNSPWAEDRHDRIMVLGIFSLVCFIMTPILFWMGFLETSWSVGSIAYLNNGWMLSYLSCISAVVLLLIAAGIVRIICGIIYCIHDIIGLFQY